MSLIKGEKENIVPSPNPNVTEHSEQKIRGKWRKW
jgi:hypothetical protein